MGWFDVDEDEKVVGSWDEMLSEIDKLMTWEPIGLCGIRATWQYKNDIRVRYYKDFDSYLPDGNPCIYAYLLTGSPTLNLQGSSLLFSLCRHGDYGWVLKCCDDMIPVSMNIKVRSLAQIWDQEYCRKAKAKWGVKEEEE